MAIRWRCNICSTRGVDGIDGWKRHMSATHEHNGRYGAQVSFGFTGDYSSRTGGFKRVLRPVIASTDQEK